MPALKDIQGICPTLGDSPLSHSPLWLQQVDQIVPAQLTAFRTKMALSGQAAEANALLDHVLSCISDAVRRGEIGKPALLDYCEPHSSVMTSGMLVRGFAQMQRPRPAAVLFGLEMNLTADLVITLTREKARRLTLTPFAKHILDSQPLHIRCRYVFWQERDRRPHPLFGLNQEVFDIFGMVWGELILAYNQMMLLDEMAELEGWQQGWHGL